MDRALHTGLEGVAVANPDIVGLEHRHVAVDVRLEGTPLGASHPAAILERDGQLVLEAHEDAVGRVAEALVLNDISTGAQNDLERASNIVRKMITEYGMSEELGPMTFGHKSEEVFLGRDISRDRNYSDAIAFAIDKEASHYMESCYKKAEQILKDNMDKLHQIAERLMEQETMEAEEFEAIITGKALNENDTPENQTETADPPEELRGGDS